MTSISPARPSPIAGMWYESNPKALRLAIERYLSQAVIPELPGKVIALIAPHAGHQYSGPVAGYAFAAIRNQVYDLVAILSPMHQPYYQSLLTTAHDLYSTPLGDVPVDKDTLLELNTNLQALSNENLFPVAYDQEHSLEIEIPFLQIALAQEFKLLPVMVRSQSAKLSRFLGEALAKTIQGKKVLVVASTDLSHFYSQKEAIRFDTEMLRRIESFSPEDVFCAEEEQKGFACGLGALTAMLWAAKVMGADMVKILRHATSGDVTGDFSSVVGYGAAVVLKTK